MRRVILNEAINECNRFLEKAKYLKANDAKPEGPGYFFGKDVAAVKRASMDLSRALANLRKG